MLFTGLGRSVWEKTVPLVLSTARGRRPRVVLKTSGTVFSHTDRPSPVSNFYFFHEKSEYPVAIREGLVIHLNAASITARKMHWM